MWFQMQSQYSSVDEVKKREILLLSKKLHYSRTTRINKFTSEIIGKCVFLIANLCLISNTASFTIISFRKLIVPAVSSGSFLICMFINIYLMCVHIFVYKVITSKWSTSYFFVTKEYQKYQVMQKQRSLYTSMLATNISQSHGFVQF